MKKLLISLVCSTVVVFAVDCAVTPVGMELAKEIEAKNVAKSKSLLNALRQMYKPT